jgi:hypothetical protein
MICLFKFHYNQLCFPTRKKSTTFSYQSTNKASTFIPTLRMLGLPQKRILGKKQKAYAIAEFQESWVITKAFENLALSYWAN